MSTDSKFIQELYALGAHLGYSKTRRHPSTKEFILKTVQRKDIIDLEKTERQLADALSFLVELKNKGHQVLFVGTKAEAKGAIRSQAAFIGMPFVIERWIGGTLTNSPEIKKRVQKLIELTELRDRDALVAATKKEKLMIEREIERLEKKFGGLRNLKSAPAALFIVDPVRESIALTEANQLGIPVVALANTNADISKITYPILANDTNIKVIQFFVKKITDALR